MDILGLPDFHVDRSLHLLWKDTEAIKGRIDEKLIARLYNRIRDIYPVAVCESGTDYGDHDPVARMLTRVGVTTGNANGAVDRALDCLGSVASDPRSVIAGKLRLFVGPDGVCHDTPACDRCEATDLCRSFSRRPTIKQLPEGERPQERLLKDGADRLSDADLLAIIIRSGTEQESAVDLARRLMTTFGSFQKLATCGIAELTRVNGIGPAKAAQIKAVLEIAKRYATTELKPGMKFTHADEVFEHYRHKLGDRKEEQFRVLLLDSQHKLIRDVVISIGSLNSSLVHPREVIAPAIKESAAAMIFVHNHPSGEPEPSEEDIALTERLVAAAQLVGIAVLDHLIIGNGRYESLSARGLM